MTSCSLLGDLTYGSAEILLKGQPGKFKGAIIYQWFEQKFVRVVAGSAALQIVVHLLMAVGKSQAGIISDEIDFSFLVAAEHHDIF